MSGRPDSFMPLYVGDYLADTMHLTTMEHGAYLLLIMRYWRSGALPDDDVILARVTGLSAAEWRRSSSVLRKFFRPAVIDGNAVLTHNRIERELQSAGERYDKAVAGANARWAKRDALRAAQADAQADARIMRASCLNDAGEHMVEQCEPQPQPQPHSVSKDETENISARNRSLSNGRAALFEAFYQAYPLHKARRAAEKAYVSALKRASPEAILAGAIRYRDDAARKPDFTKSPATWLNADCWLDEAGTPVPNPVDQLVSQWKKEAENGDKS